MKCRLPKWQPFFSASMCQHIAHWTYLTIHKITFAFNGHGIGLPVLHPPSCIVTTNPPITGLNILNHDGIMACKHFSYYRSFVCERKLVDYYNKWPAMRIVDNSLTMNKLLYSQVVGDLNCNGYLHHLRFFPLKNCPFLLITIIPCPILTLKTSLTLCS